MSDRRVGAGAIVVGIVIDLANLYPPSRGAIDALKQSGGTGGLMADFFLHPIFGIAVFLVGLGLLWARRGGTNGPHAPAPSSPSQNAGPGSANVGGSVGGDLHVGDIHYGSTPHYGTPPSPRLVVSRIKAFTLTEYLPLLIPPQPQVITFQSFVCEAWFQNEPIDRTTTARYLNAEISVSRGGSRYIDASVRGEWAIANAADNGAFDSTVPTWDELLPNGDEAKLVVAHKLKGDDDAYVWSGGAKEYEQRRHPSHRLPPSQYDLSIRIRGVGVDQTFVFLLVNPGAGSEIRLTAAH